jgi:hypothetical protein
MLASVHGLEPRQAVLETAVLPLHHTEIFTLIYPPGATGQIRTDGFTVLQTVALGHSATVALTSKINLTTLVENTGFEPVDQLPDRRFSKPLP